MTTDELAKASPNSPELSNALRALIHLRRSQRDEAHKLVQDDEGSDAAWVHALIHRIEGDKENARYWYRTSGRDEFNGTVDEEWKMIATALCKKVSRT